MPRIPFLKFRLASDHVDPPRLASYTPSLALEGLSTGVDNLRQDVYLSPRFVEQVRAHIERLILRNGNLEEMLAAESWAAPPAASSPWTRTPPANLRPKAETAELKPLLADLHVGALKRAKAEGNLSIDLLARLAVTKFLRAELPAQFAQVLERCRMMLRTCESARQARALEYREKVSAFQVAKKTVLRKAGQDLFLTLRDIEKETLARLRRSLFGEIENTGYELFLNRLVFTEDGHDDYLNAEHYVMLGNFACDPDRFAHMRQVAGAFLQSLGLGREAEDERVLDGWLNAPENAQELVGGGTRDESTAEGRARAARLETWVELLEDEKVLDYLIAAYEVVPLLSEYAPRINAQQLKNALVSRVERMRVEKLIAEHGKLSAQGLATAVDRVAAYRGAERAKAAGRFLRDFMSYHRDLRRLETLNEALDSVNLIGNEKLRQLSAVNGTLYEFHLPQEQRPSGERTLHHVVLKADIRDSTRVTRSLMERGLNPASYFSLNFYDPVNKLLSKYGASKVFLEGDAMILALLEREGEAAFAVSRTCALAREIIEIVWGYNQVSQPAGLPALELGIGISYQDSAPMYLIDGEDQIMISDALNESDRLSSCSKRARKAMEELHSPFRVYCFQTVSDADLGESMEDFRMSYNLGGIRMSEAAFLKLRQEITLEPRPLDLPALWGSEEFDLYTGLVSLEDNIFRRIVVKQSRIAQIDPRDFSFQKWTEHSYYEVCSDPAIYALLEGEQAKGAGA